jgi:ligand-binding sensor domain-containing protein/serine phosphatase RsbU (regulator of sigma subunit)
MQFRKRFVHIILRICFCLFFVCLSALSVRAQKYTLDDYTAKTGLPQNSVNDIVQDPHGYLWFATQGGAARFDGYKFVHFNSLNGLPDDYVNCLMADKSGGIWFGTQGGLAVYNGTEFLNYDQEDGMVDNNVFGMIEDLAGNIWAWTAYGISVLTGDTVLSYTKGDHLAGNTIVDVMVDSKGRVRVATFENQGITTFTDPYTSMLDRRSEIIRDMIEVKPGEIWYASQEDGIIVDGLAGEYRLGPKDGLSDTVVLCLLKDSQDRIWCGTYEQGLFVYEQGRFRKIPCHLSEEPIAMELIEDKLGRIWIRGFGNGAWMVDEGRFTPFSKANSLAHDEVHAIFEDKYGSIWIGTPGGVSKFGKGIFEIFDMDHGLPDMHVISVFMDSEERLWLGADFNICYLEGGKIVNLGPISGEEGGVEYKPLAFGEDHHGNIFVGTGYRMFRRQGESWNRIPLLADSVTITINDFLFTEDERLWCATDMGILIYNEGNTNTLNQEQGLVHNEVNALHLIGEQIYCATKGGISVFDISGNHIRDYTIENGLAWNECLDISSDTYGNLWVATKSRGVSKIDPGNPDSISTLNLENGLISNAISFVEPYDSTTLWIGTNMGINVLDLKTGSLSVYGQEEGFYPLEPYARAVAKDGSGRMWIGTVEGLVKYDPRYDMQYLDPPDLILYPPTVDGIIYSGEEKGTGISGQFPGEMNFPYSKRSLEFHFTGIHTTIPSRNTFSWYLEGFEEDWSERTTERKVNYDRLPSGRYVFRVKAYNLDGVEVFQEASFAFIIRPPIYRTIWFILFYIISGMALIYGVFKYRERQLVREKRILEHKVKLRTKEIEEQKIEIEAQRDEISGQKSFVEAQRDQIALQNTEITDSILYAKRIQQAVLPGKRMLEKTLPEHFILFKPRDIVSGDFFWVEKNEERIIVCAADCTGHGVPGAFMSLLGLTFLNEIVNHDGILKASRILDRLRVNIIRSMSHRDEVDQARDGMDVALVVIDPQLDILEYAGAFNPLVILREGELIEYKADKMPIGKYVGEEGPFTNHKIQLEHEDMVYLYSDGFSDQFGGERGSKYKAKPFKRLLTRISTEPVKTQLDLLETEFNSWMGSEDQVDDVLIMGIRYFKKNLNNK